MFLIQYKFKLIFFTWIKNLIHYQKKKSYFSFQRKLNKDLGYSNLQVTRSLILGLQQDINKQQPINGQEILPYVARLAWQKAHQKQVTSGDHTPS